MELSFVPSSLFDFFGFFQIAVKAPIRPAKNINPRNPGVSLLDVPIIAEKIREKTIITPKVTKILTVLPII